MTILNVYCDEVVKPSSNNFIILGALFIRNSDVNKVINQLEDIRCLSNHNWNYEYKLCSKIDMCKEKWHDKNNTKIHFKEIDKHAERKIIAQRWLTTLKNNLIKNRVKFTILVIDLSKLDCERFGQNKTDLNIYNKFFRTLLNGGVRYLYHGEHAQIKCVYHDEGSQEKHKYFPELNLNKLEMETSDDLTIAHKKIIFVNDDHRMYLKNGKMDLVKHSQLIQLIDIILGSFSQLFMNLSEKDDKKEVAEIMREVFESVSKREWKYPCSVSIFPKYSVCELLDQHSVTKFSKDNPENQILELLKYSGNFENEFNLKMPKFVKNQTRLDKWM